MARRLTPDVVLMDLQFRHGRVTAIGRIKAELPETEIVTMTSFIEEEKVTAALEAGASGYVLKDAEAEEVAQAIRAAYAGEVHLDPQVARLLAQRMRAKKEPEPVEPLTEREKDVMRLLGQGMSNKDIGAELFTPSARHAPTSATSWQARAGLADAGRAVGRGHKLAEPPELSRGDLSPDAGDPSRPCSPGLRAPHGCVDRRAPAPSCDVPQSGRAAAASRPATIEHRCRVDDLSPTGTGPGERRPRDVGKQDLSRSSAPRSSSVAKRRSSDCWLGTRQEPRKPRRAASWPPTLLRQVTPRPAAPRPPVFSFRPPPPGRRPPGTARGAGGTDRPIGP